MSPTKLLIVGCSATKIPSLKPIPAKYLYTGPVFLLLRKRAYRVPVFILSAQYGLIPDYQLISHYDRLMDTHRALELAQSVRAKLTNVINELKPVEVFCVLGKTYRDCIGIPDIYPQTTLKYAEGPIGIKLNQLKTWITANALCGPPQGYPPPPTNAV